MPSKNTTTVVLTEAAQAVKDDLAPVFGLKNILSAGLIMFGKLTDSEQKKVVKQANAEPGNVPLITAIKVSLPRPVAPGDTPTAIAKGAVGRAALKVPRTGRQGTRRQTRRKAH